MALFSRFDLSRLPIAAFWRNDFLFFFEFGHCLVDCFTLKITNLSYFSCIQGFSLSTHYFQNFFCNIHPVPLLNR